MENGSGSCRLRAVLNGKDLWPREGTYPEAEDCVASLMLPRDQNELDVPTASGGHGVGETVLVARELGFEPLEAMIVADNPYRPHLVKVQYIRSRAGAWILRSRIVSASIGA